MSNFYDAFEPYLKGPNTLSIKNYVLKLNEQIIGDSIVCSKCGETKRIKKFSSLFGEDIWTAAKKEGALCACEREIIKERVRKENEETFQRIYNCQFLKDLLGRGYCDVHFEDVEKLNNGNLTYQNAFKSCKSYVKNIDDILKRGLGMYIYSPNAGTGKSTLMACLRNALLEKSVRCVFVNESDLISFARDKGEFLDDNGWFTYSVFTTADVLILDDIGVGDLKSQNSYAVWRNDVLYDLIEKRNRDNRCTLFTSNYSPEELTKQRGVDFKTVDRINQRSSRIICINSDSFRGGNIIVGN